LGEARVKPSNLWCGDDEARPVVEQLIRDAGYRPVRVAGLDMAGAQEAMIQVIVGIAKDSGPYLYRMAPPDVL
jgi:predicted dinucleotide-binding enzyme